MKMEQKLQDRDVNFVDDICDLFQNIMKLKTPLIFEKNKYFHNRSISDNGDLDTSLDEIKNDPMTTLVFGETGAGKSTFLNVLMYTYGEMIG